LGWASINPKPARLIDCPQNCSRIPQITMATATEEVT
jgi:hypothetical protein